MKTSQRYTLSAKQATALRRLARAPLPIAKGRELLQTTLGSLYRRELIIISDGCFQVSEAGEKLLYEHAHADIARAASVSGGPFAKIIAELADYADHKAPPRVRTMPRHARRAA